VNVLEQLKKHTIIVADSSDFQTIEKFLPQDATTNPSLILKASNMPQYKYLIDDAIKHSEKAISEKEKKELFILKVFVNFGLEILKKIPGRVSIEVDARDSFDTEKSIEKARQIISLFENNGIDRKRILIKLASTWECIEAAKILEKENIHCNMTLLFSLSQAIACAEARVTLISPFVGRILDWYKKNENVDYFSPEEDPGVLSLKAIFNYYKKFDYKTQIMGASFRNIDEIIELCGCDLLTIAPSLLEELKNKNDTISKKLDANLSKDENIEKIAMDKAIFKNLIMNDPMAKEKLYNGIDLFSKDIEKLEKLAFEEDLINT
jgi:transaldolase